MLPLQQLRKYVDPRCHLNDEQLAKLCQELYALAQVVVDELLDSVRLPEGSPSEKKGRGLDHDRNTAISLLP